MYLRINIDELQKLGRVDSFHTLNDTVEIQWTPNCLLGKLPLLSMEAMETLAEVLGRRKLDYIIDELVEQIETFAFIEALTRGRQNAK